jgi:SAM-dependent methyltransferase
MRQSASDVEAAMDRAHAAGLTGVRKGFDRPLTVLRRHADRGAVFAAERDADRRAFNARFDTAILTEETARRGLRDLRARVTAYHDYAPIDFGGGLTIGQVASSDSGTGRWDVFNRRVVAPLIEGRRVLDLGSNNGSMPLMMLRAGARSVVGIEGSPELADVARLNGRILAWRDITAYDYRIVTGDMRLCLTENFGAVDVVTAFCSLYYLPEEDMARVIRKAAAMGATLVLQANEAIDNLPAGGETLRRLMQANGYPDVEMHTFRGFSRPLLVGARIPK